MNLILNSKTRDGLTEKGTTEQSLKEMKGVRHKEEHSSAKILEWDVPRMFYE